MGLYHRKLYEKSKQEARENRTQQLTIEYWENRILVNLDNVDDMDPRSIASTFGSLIVLLGNMIEKMKSYDPLYDVESKSYSLKAACTNCKQYGRIDDQTLVCTNCGYSHNKSPQDEVRARRIQDIP